VFYIAKMIDTTNISHSSPWLSEDDVSKVSATLCSGMVAEGSLAREFERRCAGYLGLPHTWATASGQAALIRALVALGVKECTQVVMPSYVCRAVADAVHAAGATPVYCDIGEDWCLNPKTVAAAITPKTVAIVAVHPFGIIADINSLLEFGLPVIEDCCQCFSSRVGYLGAAAVFSFHGTKCLTTGEGGMVATASPSVAERISMSLKDYPEPSRLSDLQAALGISQLARYDEMLQIRQAMASRYSKALPSHSTKRMRDVADRSIFFRFPLSLDKDYDTFAEHFTSQGIQVRRGVDTLLHRNAGLPDGQFPTTVELFQTTMSLPFYPSMSDLAIQHVLTAATEILE
jgi:perosamine synthetase